MREKRELEWKREREREFDSGRVESSRVAWKKREEQADSCGRRENETEDHWSNDSVYLLPLRRKKEKDGGSRRYRGKAKRESKEGKRERKTTRSEARKTMCWCTSTTEFIIGGKERRRAKRRD